MGRKQSLVKNVLIFGVGTSLSKLLSILLVGLYTAYILPGDYGYYDLLIVTVSMLTPLITLQITEALYRHLLDAKRDDDTAQIITCAFALVACGLGLQAVVMCGVNMLTSIRLGWILPIYTAAGVLFSFSQFAARGLRRNTVFAVSGIVNTGVMLLSNIVLIVWCGLGIEALFYSIIIADIIGIVLLEVTVGVYRRVRLARFSREALMSMCRYSVPLLPNAVAWWFLMFVSRQVIRHVIGLDANGIFGVAFKFPSLLMTVFNVFGLAWQESAITEYGSGDRNEYYTQVFDAYLRLLGGAMLLLLPATRLIVVLLLDQSYYDAWRYIPLLYLGAVFQTIAQFYASVYLSAKKTVGAFVTTLIGVFCGFGCLFLMPLIGLQAASIAQMTAYLMMLIARVIHTRKYVRIHVRLSLLLPLAGLCGLAIFTSFLARTWLDAIMFTLAAGVFLVVNRSMIQKMIGMLIQKTKGRNRA